MDSFSDRKKVVLGTLMSIFAGIMYGIMYVPIMYIQNNVKNSSQDYNDYEFSICCGILLSALLVFILYCIIEKNNPKIYSHAILPGFLTGNFKQHNTRAGRIISHLTIDYIVKV